MLKALAWKEWREQRPVVVAGVALAVVLPVFVGVGSTLNRGRLETSVEMLPIVFMAGLWPLLAAAAGAITIANEDEGGTIRFLLSRPISRGNIWWVKVASGLLALGCVATFSLFVVWSVNRLMPPEASTASFALLIGGLSSTVFDPLQLASLSLLLFACSVLASSLLNRTLTAAAAGLALALIVLSAVMLVWTSLGLSPNLEPQWVAFELTLISAGILLVSLIVFAWSDLFAGSRTSSGGGGGRPLLVGAAVVALCIAGLPVVLADAVLLSAEVGADPASVSFDGRSVAMTVVPEDESTTQVWMLHPDSGGAGPLAGRHTFAPTLVPGERWVAYLSRRGVTGARSGSLDLRIADVAGTDDRLVHSGMPRGGPLFFKHSSSGRLATDHKVAFSSGEEITVALLSGRGSTTYDVRGTPVENGVILGFNSRTVNDELLFLPAGTDLAAGGERAATVLAAYDLESATTRVVRELPAGWSLPLLSWFERHPAQRAPPSGWVWIPLLVGTKLEIVDAMTGEAWGVHDFGFEPTDAEARRGFQRCAVVELPPSRRWARPGGDGRIYREDMILFGDCSGRARAEVLETLGRADSDGLIRLRGLESGDERAWPLPADGDGSIARVFLDRAQQNVLIDVRTARDTTSYALVIDLEGEVRVFPRGWIALGWIARDWVLLKKEEAGGVRLARAQVSTGQVRGLYPQPGEVIR